MLSMVEYVHQRVESYDNINVAVDMTMGNGHDTLFLSKIASEVYSFDIQEEALLSTKEKIDSKHVHLILRSHEYFDDYVQDFDLALFNLGYMPGVKHEITTVLSSTKKAIEKAIQLAKVVTFIVVYPGHIQGKEESLWIDEYVTLLDTHLYNVSCFKMLNKKNAPYVIEIEKRAR